MKKFINLIFLLILLGCNNTHKEFLVDSRSECRFFPKIKRSFIEKSLLEEKQSKIFVSELKKSNAHFKLIENEIWLESENSRGLYFYVVYDLFGSINGFKDINGTELTVHDISLIGLFINEYDMTASRTAKWEIEKKQYEIEFPDSTKRLNKPYIALKRPTDCL